MDCKRCQKSQMKVNYKKGLWSPEEDQRLSDYVLKHGHGCWTTVPINAGLQRNGKSCRLRWINYLRPGLKHGFFTPEEDQTILNLHAKLGNKWSQIAMHLQGRTDNEVKNYWHTYLKKKLVKDKESEPSSSATSPLGMVLNELENHSSLLDSLQPMPPQKPYPKILFEEWLNDDLANSQSLENPNGLMMGNNTCMDHGSSTSRILHGFGDCDNLGAFGIQFHTSAEEALGGDSFGPFFMDEFFSNVNLNQDVQFDL